MLPAVLRFVLRLIVLVLGIALIVTSVALGWLPGPGGIPLFLAGIALLSTQFEWAKRVRAWVFGHLRRAAEKARRSDPDAVERDTPDLDDEAGDVAGEDVRHDLRDDHRARRP